MTIVNFTITETLDKQIKKVVKEKGFQSKAELFRVAVLHYLSGVSKSKMITEATEDERFEYFTARLAYLLKKKYSGKKLPSLEEQLKDI
ncbi:MAG: hypothetical protein US60_C0041G0006 [Microgenomates group bacterium GW2011_GWC1_37_8]|uniref:Ribbon-helix-helix protein CopG domain-containing protein n=1 Tax=Candidatus Woesebacteria bacterium GW2011_GWB1_38_8 TaxID=1618570 RepID=A0A0G0L0C4_9BACT|nr:MAG: hypothetical protein US60_C0041G0006 [Microgenomates group bacterium GW2011_GWC1_37_8]KKQ84457.1 MAG: hypothetical protein UT08_C0018G0063 [Candidatus Woesebacteria bacterium GW2011_GWB1_38_8]